MSDRDGPQLSSVAPRWAVSQMETLVRERNTVADEIQALELQVEAKRPTLANLEREIRTLHQAAEQGGMLT